MMRILKPAHVQRIHNHYRRGGTATCPSCQAPLKVITTPKFKTDGRIGGSTFSVACRNCGVCGAVEEGNLNGGAARR